MTGGNTTTGIIGGYLNGLATTGDSTGMQVKVATGGAWINGAYGENTSGVQTISIGASHATLNRYDLIVLRNNYTTNLIEIDVIVGPNGASPTVPTVTQNTVMHEIALAYVYVAATVTTITAANVTDQRTYNNENNRFIRQFTVQTAASSIVVDNLPARKFLRIVVQIIPTAALNLSFRYNNDSGSNYSYRQSSNTSATAVAGPVTAGIFSTTTLNSEYFAILDVVNTEAQEKLTLARCMDRGSAGAGNAPNETLAAIKWANTSNQISRFDVITSSSTLAAGSSVTILGADVPF